MLDVDSLNDTYALASELGVDVFEVYEAMQRGEARAEDALNNEDSRNNSAVHEDGDGHSSASEWLTFALAGQHPGQAGGAKVRA